MYNCGDLIVWIDQQKKKKRTMHISSKNFSTKQSKNNEQNDDNMKSWRGKKQKNKAN